MSPIESWTAKKHVLLGHPYSHTSKDTTTSLQTGRTGRTGQTGKTGQSDRQDGQDRDLTESGSFFNSHQV